MSAALVPKMIYMLLPWHQQNRCVSLNLTALLKEDTTEFESLDMSVPMLFLAGKHSYKLTRDIAQAARVAEFDGLVYPSYFSLLRIGERPFETVYGISHRRIPSL